MIVTVRASSWSSLFDCPARWYASQIEKRYLPSSPAALLGTAIHAGTAVFDQARVDGKPIKSADAADVVVNALRHPDEDVDWRNEQTLTPRTAERIALGLYAKYCAEMSPQFEFVDVEQKCAPLAIDMGGDLIIELTGSRDRRYRVRGADDVYRFGIIDLKSGGCRVNSEGEVNAHTDGPQLGQYDLLTANDTGQPNDLPSVIIGMNTRGAGNVGKIELHDCRTLLTGTREQPGLLHHAAMMFRTGLFHPNPRSMMCSPRYCANTGCRFHRKA